MFKKALVQLSITKWCSHKKQKLLKSNPMEVQSGNVLRTEFIPDEFLVHAATTFRILRHRVPFADDARGCHRNWHLFQQL